MLKRLLVLTSLASLPVMANTLEEVVVTASRTSQNLGEVSIAVDVIKDVDFIGHTHINEAAQRATGVWISRGNGQENLTAIRSPVLTGAGGCGAFLTAEDNVPLRASGFCNVNELFDVNAEQADRIEILKGPGSVWFGSNAMHGLINVISPLPNNQNSVSIEAGPHDYYRTNLSSSNQQWRVDTSLTTDGGYKHDSGFDQQKVRLQALSTLANFKARTVLSISNLNQETAGFIRGANAFEDSHASRQNPNPEAYRDSRSIRLNSRLTQQLDNGAKLTITPFLRSTRMTFLQHFLPGQAIEENGHDSFGVQSSLQFSKLTIGLDAELTKGYLEETQPNVTTGSAFLVATIPQGDHYDYEVDARVLALFANYSHELSERTVLEFGARLENVDYDYENQMLDGNTQADGTPCGFGGCRFSRPADRDDGFTNLSPKISLIHDLNDGHQVYSRVARGFRAPQATELYRLQGGQSTSRIDAEELDSFELGFRGEANKLAYAASLYVMQKDNVIFRDSNRLTVDNGETSHRGLELNLGYTWNSSWSADLAFTAARHRYENNPDLSAAPIDGNDIDTAPREFGSMRIRYQSNRHHSTELEWVYMGDYYTDTLNSADYDGHQLLNLRYRYESPNGLIFFGRITNLAGEEYAERADFAFGTDRYFVGEPTSLYLGIKTTF